METETKTRPETEAVDKNHRRREIVLPAYAKINPYLAITGRRGDGYHTLLTYMQGVTLCDTVSLAASGETAAQSETRVSLTCDDPAVPTGEENLICRAARAFFEACRAAGRGHAGDLSVHLQKRIPLAAGLGGGSADAAATLRGLNDLHGQPFDTAALCAIGVRIGADVPFCLRCREGAMTARGIGEILEPAPSLSEALSLVIARDGEGVSTPWAYGQWDRSVRVASADEISASYDAFVRALAEKNTAKIAACSFNSFESVVMGERPAVPRLMERMRAAGAVFSRMSGSGPSVVGFFADARRAALCRDALSEEGVAAHLCRPLR